MNLSKEQSLMVAECLRKVADIFEEASKATENVAPVAETKKVEKAEVKKEVKAEKVEKKVIKEKEVKEEAPVAVDRKAELEGMTFNDIKALAKSMGMKAVGTKAILIEKILDVEGLSAEEEAQLEVEDEVEEVVEEVNEETEDEEDDDDDEDEEEVEEEATLYDTVVAELADSSDEELADILSEIGISPKGKRQALLTKIVKAIEDGKLEFDTEDDEEEVEEVDDDVEEMDEDEVEEITPERASAMEELEESLRSSYKAKEISDKEIASYVSEYTNGEFKGSKKENLEKYIEIQLSLIDDEGEMHDLQDPYFVGERTLCCGQDLKELENGNMYCEICGNEYENEEE